MGHQSETSHHLDTGACPTGITSPQANSRTTATSSCVQRFSGDVDLNTVDGFASAIRRTIARNSATVIIDLTGVDFLGACGLEALARACTDAARVGVNVVLACDPTHERLVRMCRIPVTIRASIDEAYGIGADGGR